MLSALCTGLSTSARVRSDGKNRTSKPDPQGTRSEAGPRSRAWLGICPSSVGSPKAYACSSEMLLAPPMSRWFSAPLPQQSDFWNWTWSPRMSSCRGSMPRLGSARSRSTSGRRRSVGRRRLLENLPDSRFLLHFARLVVLSVWGLPGASRRSEQNRKQPKHQDTALGRDKTRPAHHGVGSHPKPSVLNKSPGQAMKGLRSGCFCRDAERTS